jgi:hypothetical protein
VHICVAPRSTLPQIVVENDRDCQPVYVESAADWNAILNTLFLNAEEDEQLRLSALLSRHERQGLTWPPCAELLRRSRSLGPRASPSAAIQCVVHQVSHAAAHRYAFRSTSSPARKSYHYTDGLSYSMRSLENQLGPVMRPVSFPLSGR